MTHARLEADGALIIATDGHPDYSAKVGENMGIALGGTDKGRLTKLFNDLAESGRIKMPLTEQPWGAAVGWLTDQFGRNWMVTLDKGVAPARQLCVAQGCHRFEPCCYFDG